MRGPQKRRRTGLFDQMARQADFDAAEGKLFEHAHHLMQLVAEQAEYITLHVRYRIERGQKKLARNGHDTHRRLGYSLCAVGAA